jgi:molybdenum cofactor guanylyltransferase
MLVAAAPYRALGVKALVERSSQIAAFILAGGISFRMGREKGLLEFQGERLIVRTARLIQPLVTKVTIIGSPQLYEALGLCAIADQNLGQQPAEEPIRTPLIGIATALNVTTAPWNLILACDLPYLTAEWLDWLFTRAVDSSAQIVMPRTSNGLEPLAAVYRKGCAERIVAALERGVRKVTDAMEGFRMEYVSESDWKEHDPENRVLTNMNTPADFEEARTWWANRTARAQRAIGVDKEKMQRQ